jgi:hypothetical protein
LTKAFVGLTASTGQLADNHDVLSLQSFSDYEVMEKAEEAKKKEKAFAPGDKDSLDIRLAKYSSPPSLPCCSSPSLPLLQNGSSDQ